ncbi:hypothetical protein GW17_00022323 [Ensete ventricosum]|nr:hypothetical protein GW17_00022323 [Ensete ventricosum]
MKARPSDPSVGNRGNIGPVRQRQRKHRRQWQQLCKVGCGAGVACIALVITNLFTFYLNGFCIILQVPFYIGELTEKVVEDDRLMVLKLSQDYLKEFIAICEALELIPEEELESSSHRGAKTPANQRAKKIARFKRQRAAEAKLQEINEKKERRRRSLRAAALSSPVEVGEEDVLDDDGEEEREV